MPTTTWLRLVVSRAASCCSRRSRSAGVSAPAKSLTRRSGGGGTRRAAAPGAASSTRSSVASTTRRSTGPLPLEAPARTSPWALPDCPAPTQRTGVGVPNWRRYARLASGSSGLRVRSLAGPPPRAPEGSAGRQIPRRSNSDRRNCRLLDHLIRPQEERLRDRQAEGLGGLEVDDKLELGRLLDGKVRGARA